ncbi:glutamine amidotransferase [Roseiconus nitratireducens]|nr:glutamine amidotransferase [Roseiconus nitratireducens]
MTQFDWDPIYGSAWVAVLAAIAIVLVIARVTPPTDDPVRRRWLVGLRSFAALVLLLAAMRPALVRTDNRPTPATLVVAIDASKSMTLPDGDGGDRWSSQQRATEQLLAGLAPLAESLDVALIAYDGRSTTVAQASDGEGIAGLAAKLENVQPVGDATDLGQAIRAAIDASSGNPLAGVVLMGDGTQTASAGAGGGATTSSAAAQRGAEVLDSLGVPMWTVPTGPPDGGDTARDIAVANLPDSFQLFAGNQFDVAFTLQTQGMANTQIPVTVSWISDDGTETEQRSRQVDTRNSSETLAMTIPMTAPPPGLYRLKVQAEEQPGEWVTGNNAQTAFVEVRDGGGRILLIEGTARPEQTFLRRALRRFPDLELDYVPIRGDRQWPVDLQGALQPGRYDIYLIGDVDANAIGDAQLKLLAERVAEGSGLVMIGGFGTFSVGGYADGPLSDVLPIKLDAALRRQPVRGVMSPAELSARAEGAGQISGPIEIEVARNHPIVDLGSGDPAAVWNSLPAMPGANRFAGTKVAAGTQVLLKTANDEPLLVIGSYGQGRVAAVAFDETYRWWRAGKAEAHRRFWRQLMLWLMSREDQGGDSVIIEMDSRRFAADAAPEFRARLQSLADDTDDITLSASLLDSADQQTPLEVTASSDGQPRISGTIPELAPGFYRLVVRADQDGVEPGELAFQVTETSRELSRPMADPLYLQQLAEMTSAHGGKAFDPRQIDQLIDRISEKRRSAEAPVIERQRLGDGPISGWLVFLLFAGALSAEWLLRRRWGMA